MRFIDERYGKIDWFSISFLEFISLLCSPCNLSTQRRRILYRCRVSSSPIQRAVYETCKDDVNDHGWAHHQGETQIHFLQCRKYPMDSSHHRCQIFTSPNLQKPHHPPPSATHEDLPNLLSSKTDFHYPELGLLLPHYHNRELTTYGLTNMGGPWLVSFQWYSVSNFILGNNTR
jgi:hypothetical protein